MFDVSSRSSFENAERVWLRELRNAADSNSSLMDCLVLVGNKIGACADDCRTVHAIPWIGECSGLVGNRLAQYDVLNPCPLTQGPHDSTG